MPRSTPEVVDVCSTAAREFESVGLHSRRPRICARFAAGALPRHLCHQHLRVVGVSAGYEAGRSDRLLPRIYGARRDADGCRLRQGPGRVRPESERSSTHFSNRYDLLLSPTMAVPAFPIDEHPTSIDGQTVDDPSFGYLPFTYPINAIGHPAASVPCGFSENGLPIGLHVVGRKGDEETVLAASTAFEQTRPWAQVRPPVS